MPTGCCVPIFKASPGDKCPSWSGCNYFGNEHCDYNIKKCKCDESYVPDNYGGCELGAGPIAGIVIGCLLIIFIFCLSMYCFLRKFSNTSRSGMVLNQAQTRPYIATVYQTPLAVGGYHTGPPPQGFAQPQATKFADDPPPYSQVV
ncbi:hypothetical protein GQR58_027490 [Nymphon striatum]|nr:hypothetical protein GQR58_027490 [Nymphon striatum]